MDIMYVIRILLVYYALTANDASALECHTCLVSDCRKDDLGCKKYSQTLQKVMKEYYHGLEFFPKCPSVSYEGSWKMEEALSKPCPHDELLDSAKCALGRLKIDYKLDNRSASIYATVTGCAKSVLLQRMTDASKGGQGKACDVMLIDNDKESYRISMQHCQENMCEDKNFCISYKQTVVKQWDVTSFITDVGTSSTSGLLSLLLIKLFIVSFVIAVLCSACYLRCFVTEKRPTVKVKKEIIKMGMVREEGTLEQSVQEGDPEDRIPGVVYFEP